MLKVLELFGGIGACTKALENLEIDFELVDYVEIDKFAVKSFNAIHNTNFQPQDICKWDKNLEVDLIMHGSSCVDFSICGKQTGGDEGSGTRSSLMYETIRIVEKLKPKYVIWENVKNLLSKKHRHNFDNYLEIMQHSGYNNYYQILNAKDYGVPQNRERVFTVSIRKDIDNGTFLFPKPFKLELRLKDMLEDEVDEKYYLSEEKINKIINWKAHQKPFEKVLGNKSISPTLTARGAGENHSGMILYSDTLEDTSNLQNECLKIKEKTKKGYTEAQDEDGVYINRPHQKRGVVQKGMIQTLKTSLDIGVVVKDEIKPKLVGGIGDKKSNGGTQYYQQDRIYDSESIAMAHPANLPCGSYKYLVNNTPLRIRKLTPKECFRLMGFDDDSFEKASKVCTNTQLYKQAGNSIVVNVIQLILNQLLLVKNKKVERGVQTSIYDFIKEE